MQPSAPGLQVPLVLVEHRAHQVRRAVRVPMVRVYQVNRAPLALMPLRVPPAVLAPWDRMAPLALMDPQDPQDHHKPK